jgi:hypothetical protein
MARLAEVRLEEVGKRLCQGRLDDPVAHRRHPQFPDVATRFRPQDALERFRTIAAIGELQGQQAQLRLGIGGKLRQRLLLRSGTALRVGHLLEGFGETSAGAESGE